MSKFKFKLNDKMVCIVGYSPQSTLLDFVRSLGLTGSKEGCAEGECGACTVLFIEDGPRGTRYCPVNSCLVALPMAAGQEVLTVEGLAANDHLTDVQRAMAEGGGSQCGYCTPGFVVSMFAEHCRRKDGRPHVASLGGNLCRCTGYRPIRDALLSLGTRPAGPHLARLDRPPPRSAPMRYATDTGRFSRPGTLAECFDLIEVDPDARLVAGNTDLGVMTNLNGERFAHLVAVDSLAELRVFQDSEDFVEIGCGLTLSEIKERWTAAPAAIDEWLKLFASPQIRSRATLGGNLATASPIGDSAPLLLALDADIIIRSRGKERAIPLASFFIGYRQTVLERQEVLISIRIAKPLPDQVRFYKVAKRLYNDISTVAAGMSLRQDGNGTIRRARIAFGGLGPTPLRAFAAEKVLVGSDGDEEHFDRARELVLSSLAPISDHRGSARYRVAIAQNLLSKFHSEISKHRTCA